MFHEKPSDLFGINHNRWLAWQFDNAVMMFGTWVQNRLDETDDKGKRKYKTLAAALDLSDGKPKPINIGRLMSIPGVKVK